MAEPTGFSSYGGEGFAVLSGSVCDLTGLESPSRAIFALAKMPSTERGGFEPPIGFTLYTLSKRAPSATRPSLHIRKATLVAFLMWKLRRSSRSERRRVL